MAKSLVKLFLPLRKTCSLFRQYPSASRFCHGKSLSPELAATETVIGPPCNEELYHVLQTSSPKSILALIQANKTDISSRHVLCALSSMRRYYVKNKVPCSEIHDSPEFVKMCDILDKYMRRLDHHEVIRVLQILNILEVPSPTTIMQELLQLVRVSINDLYLDEIYFLSFLLRKMKPTHLGNAILEALPLLFDRQLKIQLDKDNEQELIDALRFIRDHMNKEPSNINPENISYILDALDKHTKPFKLHNAIMLYLLFCDIKILPHNYLKVLYRVKGVIIKNVKLCSKLDTMKTLSKTFKKIIHGIDSFYDTQFIDKLISQVIADDYGNEDGISILRNLNRINHINIPLLEYLFSLYHQNPTYFSCYPPWFVFYLIKGLADAHFKPQHWDELKDIILKNCTKIPDNLKLCHVALYLASFDCFDSKILAQVFDQNFFRDNQTVFKYPEDYETLQIVYQCSKTLYPEYSGPWPSDNVMEIFKSLKREPTNTLIPALTNIFGDSSYIQSNLKTNLGHQIDHLIIFQNGSPITIKTSAKDPNDVQYVEDLDIPPNSDRLVVQLLLQDAFARNIDILRPQVLMHNKSLEALSYKVVSISINTWNEMPDEEIIPYLKRSIREKIARREMK